MSNQAPSQPTPPIPQAPAPMQVLSPKDLRAVAGGPEITNGGGGAPG